MDTGSHVALCDAETHGRCASPGMNFNINPSLLSRAAITVTAALWYHEDVLNPDKIYRLSRNYTEHEDRVADNARSLLIPKTLKEDILASIRPVKNQLQHWIRTHGEDILYDVYLYNDFCWTSIGLIDFTKTANNIIRRGGLTPIKAFKLACISWSVEHIYKLWPLVRHDFNKNKSFSQGIEFWVRYLQYTFETRKPYHKLPRKFFREAFDSACFDGNVSALRLFEPRNLEVKKHFICTAPRFLNLPFFSMEPHALLVFLSYMDASQQDEFLKKYPVKRLIFFLKWPLRDFFLQLADKLWEYCTEDDFCEVIRGFTEKIRLRKNEASIYKKIFIQFWKRSPLELRNHYIKTVFGAIFRDIFYPLPIDNDLNILYSGAYDEKILYKTFLNDPYTSLDFILQEDKPRAFKAFFQEFLSSIRPQTEGVF